MSARKKSLNVSAYTLDGNDHLGDFLMLDFAVDLATEDGSGGASAYTDHEETKRKSTHEFEIYWNNGSGARINAPVGVTVLDMKGDILGSFTSCSCEVANTVEDGSGAASLDEFANAQKSELTISSTRFIAASESSIAQLTAMQHATPSERNVTVQYTFGGWVLSAPMKLTRCRHNVTKAANDKFDVTLKSKGTPTLTNPGGGAADIMSVALEGDAIISLAATTGPRPYVGVGIITRLAWDIADRQLMKARGTLDIQGALTTS